MYYFYFINLFACQSSISYQSLHKSFSTSEKFYKTGLYCHALKSYLFSKRNWSLYMLYIDYEQLCNVWYRA